MRVTLSVFIYLFRYLLIYLSRWPRPGFFRSSSQIATCYYESNHSKL